MSVGKTMILSEVDHKILESYKTVLEGLADYLGDGCEIALHSLEDYDKSVIKIVNGHHTGREVGAPITNLALDMLDKIKKDGAKFYISYFAKNKRGNPIKSATIAIKGEYERIIGLLCININLNMPMLDFLSVFLPYTPSNDQSTSELFSNNRETFFDDLLYQAKAAVDNDPSIKPSLHNRAIIEILYQQGVFNMKNAVEHVAELLEISKNTVYLHLRSVKGNSSETVE